MSRIFEKLLVMTVAIVQSLWDYSNIVGLVHNAPWRPEVTTVTDTVTETL